jgi:hypothetical protein
LDVLSANQSQQRLQRSLLSARLDLILIRIGLYLALAGDFDTRPDAALNLPSDVPQLPSELNFELDAEPIFNVPPESSTELPGADSELPTPADEPSSMVQPAREIDINE